MTVYLVILEDRHTDVEVRVFANESDAMVDAQDIVDYYDYEDDEPPIKLPENWLFNARLSCESDHVRVEKAEVQL